MSITERKPGWLRTRFNQGDTAHVMNILKKFSLTTVCKEASCPNMGECYSKNTATFMIMGNQCTRKCRFCNVTNGDAAALDAQEPERLAKAVAEMGLKHVVITSVTRDDLKDGGAVHFARCIEEVKKVTPETTIEVLIPDLKGDTSNLDIVIDANPDVLTHNVETVKGLYKRVRPEAVYSRSLFVLSYSKRRAPNMLTKTGLMAGLGETERQLLEAMDDILETGCDILTIGQYLRPTKKHLPIAEYVTPEQFEKYRISGEKRGFVFVASAPLVRSSYRADEAVAVSGALR